jgi:hypothetical protein
MLTGKMDKIVSEHYAKTNSLKPPDNKNDFWINTDSLPKINGFCKSDFENFYIVPLFVYFYSTENIKCTVNPKLYVNTTVSEINKLLENDHNLKKLSGKKIEISFVHIPNTFNHQYKNHFILLQVLILKAYLSISKNKMYYAQGNFKINYIIRDKETLSILKQGSLNETIPFYLVEKQRKQSRKIFAEKFVTSYDNNMTKLCQTIAQLLVEKI